VRHFADESAFSKGARVLGALAAVWLGVRAATAFGDNPSHWIVVARDSSYTISLDTTRIASPFGHAYTIWYRTDHAGTRFYKEQSFTRETVHALLRCNTYQYVIMSAEMSIGSGRPVIRQITEPRDVRRQPWRDVEAGSAEADAARMTCRISARSTSKGK
jgi:hypothetical protein